MGLRDEGQELSSGFTSHVPHDPGVPAVAATSGRVISKASGDLGDRETGCTMASPPPHGPHPTSWAPPLPGAHGQPGPSEFNRCSLQFPSHGAACPGCIKVLIKPRIPLQAKISPWCWPAPSSQLSIPLHKGVWLPWGVLPPLHGRHTS